MAWATGRGLGACQGPHETTPSSLRQWLALESPHDARGCRLRLAAARAEFAALGVRSLDLLGSVARGEVCKESDVDLLVDFGKSIGLFHFFRVQRRLERSSGHAWIWSCETR